MKKVEDGFWVVSWMTDVEGRCANLGPYWQQLTGQSNKAALGSGWLDAICPDDRKRVKNELAKANRGETPLRLAFRLRRADGAFFWVLAVGGPRYDEAGVFQGFVGSITDIDDQIRTDQRLMEVQHRLQAIMNAAPIGLSYSNGPDCQHITGNSTLFSQFEISPTDNISASAADPEAAGRRIRFFKAGRELTHGELPLQRAVRERREIAPMELEVLLPSGRRWFADVSGAPVLGRDGEVLGGVAVTVDVTARRKAEEALRNSEARFASFMRHLPGLAWIKNVHGRYVFVNDAAEKAFRTPRAGLYGKTDEEIFPSDTAAQFCVNDQKARASEAGFTAIETLEHEDGVLHHSLVSKFPIRDAAKTLVGVGGVAIDITERVIAEQKLLEATERLREADKRKDEFLATLAHELRNPLAPIRNGLQVLRRAAGQSGLAERVQDMMGRQVDHLVRLVDDLLEVSRITHGRIELKKERVALSPVVGHAVDMSRDLIDTKELQLRVVLPSDPLLVDADPVRLAQVFSNLLNNAAKFTDKGGRIEVTAQRAVGEAIVSVTDTGAGISKDMLPRVFDLFAQSENTLVRTQGGLGIGLALVRGLVELHGGKVEAASKGEGRGSRFNVRLPLSSSAEPTVTPQGPTPAERSTRRVLIVDDTRDVADSFALLLETLGAEVRVAYSGTQGLATCDEFEPELIFLDIGMPQMDGFETARRLRLQQSGRKATLVALTGWGEEDMRRRVKEAGFDRHLTKPADLEQVEALLEAVSGKQLQGNPD